MVEQCFHKAWVAGSIPAIGTWTHSVARLTRLPVTEKIRGSNPLGSAIFKKMNYYTDVIKKYSVFGGRAARKEYWMFSLYNLLISIGIVIVLKILSNIIGTDISRLRLIYSLFVFNPSLAVTFRRLHDANKSGWYLCWIFLPIIGAIVLLLALVKDSQAGENRYGPNQKSITITKS